MELVFSKGAQPSTNTRNTNFADVPSPWSSEGLPEGEMDILSWQ